MTKTRLSLAVGVVVVLAFSASAVAGDASSYQIRFNAKDQAAARAVLVRTTDLQPTKGWHGGPRNATKADLAPIHCAKFHPRVSDLVITGAAEAAWNYGPFLVSNITEVFRNRELVERDWQRSVQAPGALACMKARLARQLGSTGKSFSFKAIGFPHVAPHVLALRELTQTTRQGVLLHVVLYDLLLARGRTEITLASLEVGTTTPGTDNVERLARILLARAHA